MGYEMIENQQVSTEKSILRGDLLFCKSLRYCLLICMLGLSTSLFGQQSQQISGVVLDENENPLIGATILEKGTSNGTTTDIDGAFELQLQGSSRDIVVSYVGYADLEVSIDASDNNIIVLRESSTTFDEIVVIGYGTQQREDVTGSISSISSEVLENQPAASFDKLMQGRAPGVLVSQSSGAPGGRTTIRIRGASSINAGNEPLLVIDGVPLYNSSKDPGGTSYGTFSATNALSSINPNDIESIEVLKDASATAIYGSRGSNGVVIITTKRGATGKAQVDYNGYYGMQNVVNPLELMNGQEHAEFLNDWAVANDLPVPFDNPAAIGEGTDWQDEIFRSAPMMDHQLSVSGGTENTKYFISGNYFKQDGIVINSGLDRYAVRLNVDQRISDKFRLSQSFSFTRTVNNSVPIRNAGADNVRSAGERAYSASPTAPLFDSEGNYNDVWYGLSKNESPVASLLTTESKLTGDNLLGNLAVDYEVINGLTFRSMLGVNLTNRSNEEFYPGSTTYIGGLFGGLGLLSNRRITNILNENTLRFTRSINDMHSFEVLAGFTWQTETDFSSSSQPTTFPTEVLGINSIGGTTGTPLVSSGLSDWSIVSFLGRVNYEYNNRFLLTATIRTDGSSRFAEGNKWGYFPSVALGYRLSEEQFIKDLNLWDNLKVRLSYGSTGNQQIGNYQSLSRLATNLIYIFDNQLVSGSRQTSLSNQDLTWEKSNEWDFGIDMSLLDSRLRLTFDVYRKNTEDLLFTINLPSYSGFSTALYNTGSLENKGFEIDLGVDLIQSDLSWTLSANYSRNRTEMTSLGESGATNLFVGYAPGVGLSYIYDGVFRDEAEIQQQTAQAGVQPGDIRYQDTNNDGVFDANDRVLVGKPNPDYIFGINNELSYKGLSLSFFLQGVIGQDGNKISRLFNPADVESNKARILVDRWTPSNPDSDIARAGASNWLSSSFLRQDLSFVKLRNIQLGYTLPPSWVSGIRNVKLYVSGQNLVTWTKDEYFGYDPDGSTGYPSASTLIFGLNLGF